MRLTLLVVCCSTIIPLLTFEPAAGQSLYQDQTGEVASRPGDQDARFPTLSPGPQEVATELGIAPLLEQLFRLPDAERCGRSTTLESLRLRQEITELVISTSLEIDGVFAEIDNEIRQIDDARTELENRRDRALKIGNIAGIVTGGALGVAATALQFKDSTAQIGNGIGVGGGAVSTFLSVLGIRQQRGGRRAFVARTNMLAKLFDRQPKQHSDYPHEVWIYLNAKPPTEPGPETRIQRLIGEWVESGRLDSNVSRANAKIALLTDTPGSSEKFSIDLLNDRAAMLSDVRLRVSFMKRDLSKLLIAADCHYSLANARQ